MIRDMTHTCCECNGVTGETKRHKHIWMYSSFCDTCNCDFDKWLQKEKDQVVFDIVCKDFNHMICQMASEGKFDDRMAAEIYMRMRDVARARGFLKLPWEKEEEERDGWIK